MKGKKEAFFCRSNNFDPLHLMLCHFISDAISNYIEFSARNCNIICQTAECSVSGVNKCNFIAFRLKHERVETGACGKRNKFGRKTKNRAESSACLHTENAEKTDGGKIAYDEKHLDHVQEILLRLAQHT